MSEKGHSRALWSQPFPYLAGLFPAASWVIGFALSACAARARPVLTAQEHNARAVESEALPEVRAADHTVTVLQEPEPQVLPDHELPPEPNSSAEKVVPEYDPVPRGLPQLDAFYSRLDEVRAGVSQDAVRVLWLGDSHTAADFFTDPIRAHLDETVRDGGPGFVRLGLDGYRHGRVSFQIEGRFRKAPILPAQRTRVLDGVFGYGGIRTVPTAGARVTARIREPQEQTAFWTLSYRLARGDQLDVRIGDSITRLTYEEQPHESPGILSRTFSGPASEAFSVAHAGGEPQIFGAFVEYETPGVVLDTVGINGARVATTLAWEPEQYRSQLQRRKLDLLVLAFGTNEIFDRTRVEKYREHIASLVELVRREYPDLPCWIVGPPDAGADQGRSRSRVSEVTDVQRLAAKELACAFSSQYALMGGEGSFSRWMSLRPAMARSDYVHFTIAGYRELGRLLGEQLLPPTDATEDPPPELLSWGSPHQFSSRN